MLSYPSDVSNFQWFLLRKFFKKSPLGRPPIHSKQKILSAIFYVLRSGCQWNMLPKDFPPFQTVYDYFMRWKKSGLWALLNSKINSMTRKALKRKISPSLAIIDSQSVKGFQGKQKEKGIDGFKKVNGRKRHLLVDTQGLILACFVTPANVHDSQACIQTTEEAFKHQNLERLEVILADKGYRGKNEKKIPDLFDVKLKICSADKNDAFEVRPKRWIVERTNAWLSASRRTGKDYEVIPSSSVAWVYIANIRLGLRKIEKHT